MVIINEESKKRYRHDNEELEKLGLTFDEYTELVREGVEWLGAIENGISDSIGLEAFQRPSLGYLIGASVASVIGSIQYGYYLLTGVPPMDTDVSNIPEEQYREQRMTLLKMMKEDFFQDRKG